MPRSLPVAIVIAINFRQLKITPQTAWLALSLLQGYEEGPRIHKGFITTTEKMGPKPQSVIKGKKIESKYANCFRVGANPHEFVIEFWRNCRKNDQAELCARIVTSPAYATALYDLLKESIAEYKQVHGSIEDDANQD